MKIIDYMFYIPIFHYKVNDWKNKKKNLLEFWNSTLKECEEEDNVFHNFHAKNQDLDKFVHSTFIEEINNFLIDLERNENEYRFLNSWFENTVKNGYHAIHNHGPLGYSSVCFINYDETQHTPTQFYSPFNSFIDGKVLEYSPEDISEGSILFFPSNVSHYTQPNNSDVERLVVSFNLGFDQLVIDTKELIRRGI